jgi:hypothetical protein
LIERIFAVDQIVAGKIPAGDDACRFDANVLEMALQELIAKETETGDSNAQLSDTIYTSDRKPCPTFVVATSAFHNEGHPVLFRSYNCKGANANKCAIWQAVRCTCADPSFFRPMFIESPPPGSEYIGSHIHNNPSVLALEEASWIWPSVKQFCLVSIGTGRQKSANFVDLKDLEQPNPKSSFTSTFFRITGVQTLRKTMSGIGTLKQIREACMKLSGSAEPVHQRLQASANPNLQRPSYFRFNVEREMDSIEFQEWKAMRKIHQLTVNYMTEQDQKSRLNSCAQALSKPSDIEQIGISI